MFEFFTALLGHPILFTIVLLVIMGLVAMTYEFILRLFCKRSMVDDKWNETFGKTSGTRWPDDLEDDPPPECPKVKKPIDPNDGQLKMAKGFGKFENEKEETYVMDPGWNDKKYFYQVEKKEG